MSILRRSVPRYLQGFTVTELLIVIVVIGILASIAIILYPGYQQRTRDNERKNDMQQIVAALNAYAIQKNDFVGEDSGCGINGDGNGWFNAGPAQVASYPKAIVTCLQEAGVLETGEFVDPLGCLWSSGGNCGTYDGTPTKAYMKATCQKGSQTVTYVFAYLETQPRKDAEVDGLCDSGTVLGFTSDTQKWGTHYGMNYYVAVR